LKATAKALFLGVLLSLLFVPSVSNSLQGMECVRLYIKHKIIVRTDIDTNDFSTKYWNSAYRVERVKKNQFPKVCFAVESFYKKYPILIDKNLVSINVVNDIRYRERITMSGTYKNGVIYLKSQHSGHTAEYLEKILHHEFSSIMTKTYPFPWGIEWVGASAKRYNFDYTVLEVGRYDARDERHELLRDGFVNVYAARDFENDFNMCAEYLWTMPKRFKELGRKYPRIETKRRLIKKYYERMIRSHKKLP